MDASVRDAILGEKQPEALQLSLSPNLSGGDRRGPTSVPHLFYNSTMDTVEEILGRVIWIAKNYYSCVPNHHQTLLPLFGNILINNLQPRYKGLDYCAFAATVACRMIKFGRQEGLMSRRKVRKWMYIIEKSVDGIVRWYVLIFRRCQFSLSALRANCDRKSSDWAFLTLYSF